MDAIANLWGYQVTAQLYSGSRTLVYRGLRESDQKPVVIKLLRNEYPTFNELIHFRNQYTIAKNLDLPSIVKPLDFVQYKNTYALVMEDFGGISLPKYLSQKTGEKKSESSNILPLTDFFDIAIQLANSLDGLIHQRVIHKDIKPANILINPDTKQVKLIDFSISSLLPRETQEIQNPNVLEGTIAYLSPEQTGRMNRGIDYRTDFYSLGVTFYELLTGKLPFISNDPMELVHCHIAKIPPTVHTLNPAIPPFLSAIVSKLMAKNAENRYQSAFGLKYDLEMARSQWQETGAIPTFEIGQRDLTNRFLIPEKLYGREQEVKTLLKAFERVSQGSTEMMLVAGFSGIGKTAVVNEVHKPIVRQRGYFIKGKYDQFQRNIPFSAFVQAFRDLMGQLLSESDAQLQAWKTKILEVVGNNGQVLIDVIPELERIIDPQPPATELSGSAAQNRFNLLMQKFVQVFTTAKHPLVMFLDDLQWADSASLNLLQLLMVETEHLLILGAYRDNEVSPAHPFILTLDAIVKNRAVVNTITLQPLNLSDMNQLVADTINCELSLSQNLTELVYQKTKGNPFFSTQFLKALYEDGHITFDPPQSPLAKGGREGGWQCDLAEVRALAITNDVVEFMALQLQKLPVETQNALKLAACIGTQFDLNTLAIVSKKSPEDTATALWRVLQEGLIIPNTEVYKFFIQSDSAWVIDTAANPTYRFLHDRVQQAAYSLIPENQKQLTHLTIGQLLFSAMNQSEKHEKIFEIINHLNKGADLISLATEREELAKLNLAAAQRAKSATAYVAAIEYSTKGISLLTTSCWQQCYELTLALHDIAAEVTCLSGDFRQMEQIVDEVLQNARQLLDKVKVYEVKILAYVAQSNQPQAIKTALSTLKLFGLVFPDQPTNADITESLQQTQDVLKVKDLADLLELPEIKDPQALAAIRILATVTAAVYQAVPELLPLIVCKQVRLSVEYGNANVSAQIYAWYGVILCSIGEIDLGDRVGQLAMGLLSRFESREFKASTINMVYPFVKPWKHHIQESLTPLLDGYHSGLEMGTLEYAAYCAYNYCSLSFFLGKDLSILEPEMKVYSQALAQLKQEVAHNYLKVFYQSVSNLLGQSNCPWEMQGVIYDEQIILPLHEQSNDLYGMGTLYINKLILCCLFNEWEEAIKVAVNAKQYLSGVAGCFMVPVFHFYDSLAHLAMLPNAQVEECDRLPQEVIDNQKKLEQWANYAPTNHLHKFYLVEAEQYRVLGQKYKAMDYYDRAIASAKENAYIQEEALANEIAAKFYLDWGKQHIAQEYTIQAYYGYARWGAKAKVTDLETRYPQLLAPILHQNHSTFSTNETIFALETVASTTSVTSHSNSVSGALDLATILKASQAISGEIELEKLLSSLLSIIIENAGANKCVLMLLRDDRLLIKGSIIQGEEPVLLQRLPVEDSQDIPLKLIYKVKHNRQTIVLLNATVDPILVSDPYIMRQQPYSILCSPILHQGQLMGILYLENNLVTGAFTSDRVELLNLLCTQAAISLENARLYEQSQTYAQKLERSLNELSASNSRFEKLVDNVPGVVYQARSTADGVRYLTYVSAECYDLFEITPEQAIANMQVLTESIHPEDSASYKQSVTDSIKTLTPLDWSGRVVTSSGILKWIHIETRIQKLADGTLVWDGLVLDISDRKQAELALEQKSLLLEQALHNLQNTQLQMIQSEKMSALGNLVAGVAHEINNPLGFISGNLNEAKSTVKDLVEHLNLYRDRAPETEITNHAEDIDLDYIIEDLPKMIDSMQLGCDRIQGISTSLRTFSRADKDYKVLFNIHEGIDSTILILKYRLKASDDRPAIEVVKDYGNIPDIECFPGQINQVFMNIIANAIDALDESNGGRTFAEIKSNPNRIKIATFAENQEVKIVIADNGKGITEAVQEKIFDQSFTTKGVGKGTGLGLAIARQIIEEKHRGKIKVNSVPSEGTVFEIAIPVK